MIAKIYLVIVSFIYFALAIWCSVSPAITSHKVGFQLQPGTGQSEFLTVYGGLEFGIALILLLSVLHAETIRYGLITCVVLHGSLVIFRSLGFFFFTSIGPFTYRLAAAEWGITLLGIAVLVFGRHKG